MDVTDIHTQANPAQFPAQTLHPQYITPNTNNPCSSGYLPRYFRVHHNTDLISVNKSIVHAPIAHIHYLVLQNSLPQCISSSDPSSLPTDVETYTSVTKIMALLFQLPHYSKCLECGYCVALPTSTGFDSGTAHPQQ